MRFCFWYNLILKAKNMKIRLLSDLHTEFRLPYKTQSFSQYKGEDVLVLAGDIASGSTNVMDVIKFFKDQGFPNIVYVAGNHEYYGTSIEDFNTKMAEKCAKLDNVHFLNRDSVEIEGVMFIGATLWTNFRGDPMAELLAKKYIADFKYIRDFSTAKALTMYREDIHYISSQTFKHQDKKCVVVTHFLPTDACISDRFRDPRFSDLNPYFANDLEVKISTFNNVAWLFGHTHDAVDKVCGTTRLVCNPHGYYNAMNDGIGFDPFKTIEV
jgi:predicted phosphodiesterase